jgi:hypothetical protein
MGTGRYPQRIGHSNSGSGHPNPTHRHTAPQSDPVAAIWSPIARLCAFSWRASVAPLHLEAASVQLSVQCSRSQPDTAWHNVAQHAAQMPAPTAATDRHAVHPHRWRWQGQRQPADGAWLQWLVAMVSRPRPDTGHSDQSGRLRHRLSWSWQSRLACIARVVAGSQEPA